MIAGLKGAASTRYATIFLVFLVLVSAAASLGMVAAPTHQQRIRSIFDLGYFVGPTTQSLLKGKGLLVCSERMGTPQDPICFHSARMPMASTILAAGVMLLGDHPKQIDAVKTLLFLVPLWLAMAIVLRWAAGRQSAVLACGTLLLVPLFVVNLLVVVASMEVEEGYLYGLIALALTLLFFPLRRSLRWTVAFALLLDLIFITKSSMLLVVAVLLLSAMRALPSWSLRVTAFLMVALAPVSWAVYQHHADGRYSVGTSLDGLNLHKGNNAKFLERYPTSNSQFDSYDSELNSGQYFRNEWPYNDYHMAAGRQFIFSHPGATLAGFFKKAAYLLFSLKSYTATRMSRSSAAVALVGIVLFRLLLWSATGLSLYVAVSAAPAERAAGRTFLAFLAAYCFPYLVGFGFMRHAVVLAYPSAILCCFLVATRLGGRRTGVERATLKRPVRAAI